MPYHKPVPGADPLSFDPVEEARRQWGERWSGGDALAAATSIVRAYHIVLAAVDDALRPWDLNLARYEALLVLYFARTGSLPLGKMSERLMVHSTSITNVVDRLEARDLAKRVPHPTDRRVVLAVITEEGRRVVEEATKAVVPMAWGLKGLSTRDLDQLTRTVRKLRLAAGDFSI